MTGRKPTSSRLALWCAGVATVSVVAACTAQGTSSTGATSAGAVTPSASATRITGAGAAAALQQAFVTAVARVRPSVVEVSTGNALGSGVVYDSRGDIVTNAHVVGSATTFSVKVLDGQQLSATLVGAYPTDDLAVIRVSGAKNLHVARFSDSRSLQVGDIVFAVGNPLGLASSVTDGIISYNGRPVSEGNGVTLAATLQTSAAINHGNSGGALADLDGGVVGIPTLAAVDQESGGAASGIGFAIPSSTVTLIAPQLIATGRVTHSGRAALGISASDAVDAQGNPTGVQVVSTTPQGSAAKAGLSRGDVITKVNGTAVTSLAELQSALAGLAPESRATLTVTNQAGQTRTVPVVLGQLP